MELKVGNRVEVGVGVDRTDASEGRHRGGGAKGTFPSLSHSLGRRAREHLHPSGGALRRTGPGERTRTGRRAEAVLTESTWALSLCERITRQAASDAD